MTRRIIRKLIVAEISAVDQPTQLPARAVSMGRDNESD